MYQSMSMNSDTYSNLFKDIFRYPEYLMGDKQAEEPAIIEFLNGRTAANMLYNHIVRGSKILIHTDVDMDGIGSCYILRNWLKQVSPSSCVECVINVEKKHGVSFHEINYFNSYTGNDGKNFDLVIILDSATNDIDYIRNINCDCLVIDHHEISISENNLCGSTVKGNYVIINSMSPNGFYEGGDCMSAGLTVYEFLRYFQSLANMSDVLYNGKYYQWAVITLFTDFINNDNLRNIYYIQTTRNDSEKEPGLSQMLSSLGCNAFNLNKSDIGFTLAPTFNRAIRSGNSQEALNFSLFLPNQISYLKKYKDIQDNKVKDFELGSEVRGNGLNKYVIKDITELSRVDYTYPNYAGLMAMKLLDKYSATSIVYRDIGDGYVSGSFRGLSESVDYRKLIVDMGYYAAGHKTAFGFKFPKDKIDEIMTSLVSYEKGGLTKNYLTAGYVGIKGKHHIDDMTDFMKHGMLWKLGSINSMMASNINIIINSAELEYKSVNDKKTFFIYKFYGVELKAFEEIRTPEALIYVEYQDNLRLYVKNK